MGVDLAATPNVRDCLPWLWSDQRRRQRCCTVRVRVLKVESSCCAWTRRSSKSLLVWLMNKWRPMVSVTAHSWKEAPSVSVEKEHTQTASCRSFLACVHLRLRNLLEALRTVFFSTACCSAAELIGVVGASAAGHSFQAGYPRRSFLLPRKSYPLLTLVEAAAGETSSVMLFPAAASVWCFHSYLGVSSPV